jgi:hypothetical protein
VTYLLHRNYPEHVIKEQLQLHHYEEREKLLYRPPNDQPSNPDIIEKKEKRFYLHNIAGRDKVEHFGRSVYQDIIKSNSERYDKYQTTWITFRGSNLRDELNKYNRKILSSRPMRPRL